MFQSRKYAGYETAVEVHMKDPVDALILDLLEWLEPRPRPYAEVLEVWRTSCPRLPVWEEANARGYVDHKHVQGREPLVLLTTKGKAHLAARRSWHAAAQAQQGNVRSLSGTS